MKLKHLRFLPKKCNLIEIVDFLQLKDIFNRVSSIPQAFRETQSHGKHMFDYAVRRATEKRVSISDYFDVTHREKCAPSITCFHIQFFFSRLLPSNSFAQKEFTFLMTRRWADGF